MDQLIRIRKISAVADVFAEFIEAQRLYLAKPEIGTGFMLKFPELLVDRLDEIDKKYLINLTKEIK